MEPAAAATERDWQAAADKLWNADKPVQLAEVPFATLKRGAKAARAPFIPAPIRTLASATKFAVLGRSDADEIGSEPSSSSASESNGPTATASAKAKATTKGAAKDASAKKGRASALTKAGAAAASVKRAIR